MVVMTPSLADMCSIMCCACAFVRLRLRLHLRAFVFVSSVVIDRLYFLCTRHFPRDTRLRHYFTIDDYLLYEPFYADFGPLHLACLYRFCLLLKDKMEDETLAGKEIHFYTNKTEQNRSNGAYLITSFAVCPVIDDVACSYV